jgi:hypothetical protein
MCTLLRDQTLLRAGLANVEVVIRNSDFPNGKSGSNDEFPLKDFHLHIPGSALHFEFSLHECEKHSFYHAVSRIISRKKTRQSCLKTRRTDHVR